jgi:N-acetylglucosamine kinase-like BadF-type ATPase
MRQAPVFVGIDGGATRATALATDAGGVELVRIRGEAARVLPGAGADVARLLARLARQALAAAGFDAPAAALCCALAGAGREEEQDAVRAGLAADGCAVRVRVTGDVDAAFHDAFGNGPGMLLIAGTGSIAFGRSAHGEWVRVGGWGDLLGDEGSGYALGLGALRAVARAEDGRGRPTSLAELALRHAARARPAELIAWAAAATKADIAALAPAVLAEAGRGDAVARALAAEAVSELIAHVEAMTARLARAGDALPRLALGGGLLAPGRPLRGRLLDAVVRMRPAPHVLDVEVDAARGAAALARAEDGAA